MSIPRTLAFTIQAVQSRQTGPTGETLTKLFTRRLAYTILAVLSWQTGPAKAMTRLARAGPAGSSPGWQ